MPRACRHIQEPNHKHTSSSQVDGPVIWFAAGSGRDQREKGKGGGVVNSDGGSEVLGMDTGPSDYIENSIHSSLGQSISSIARLTN